MGGTNMEIGESLVGAYQRHVRQCHTVAFNQFIPGKQGEIDVIGIAGAGDSQRVWMAEVAVHLDGLKYGGYENTALKIATKVATAREYATEIYVDSPSVIEFWSPYVPSGLVTLLEQVDVELVVNHDFTDRINELAELASRGTKRYGDEGFRFLQLMTHLKGDRPIFAKSKPK